MGTEIIKPIIKRQIFYLQMNKNNLLMALIKIFYILSLGLEFTAIKTPLPKNNCY